MPRYDNDDKAKMLELAAIGYTYAAIARRFGCSPTYVADVVQEYATKKVASNGTTPTTTGTRKVPKWLDKLPSKVDLSSVSTEE